MPELPKAHSHSVRLFFFWCGIMATFLYRMIVVLNNVGKVWVQVAWYAGTVGFLVYFIHRYQISERRAKAIREFDLEQKVANVPGLTPEDRQAMGYLFSTLQSSREKWNSIFIFVTSGMALVVGIILDFILKH